MRLTKVALGTLTIVLGVWGGPVSLYAQSREMDVTQSSLTIRVFKSGVFSAFARDHEIKTPIEKGRIDSSANSRVQLHVDARKLRVLDPEIAAEKRAEIQRTMEGLTVLDSEHFPDISYQSTTVTKHWGCSLGSARESRPAWNETTSGCRGFLTGWPLPRVGILQAEQFWNKSDTYRWRQR